jgi:hypothetical protein
VGRPVGRSSPDGALGSQRARCRSTRRHCLRQLAHVGDAAISTTT